jgi:hypothetical protein
MVEYLPKKQICKFFVSMDSNFVHLKHQIRNLSKKKHT